MFLLMYLIITVFIQFKMFILQDGSRLFRMFWKRKRQLIAEEIQLIHIFWVILEEQNITDSHF